MSDSDQPEPWTYDRFIPGMRFPAIEIELDDERVAAWEQIYGKIAVGTAPRGLLLAAAMEAFIRSIQPRPAGNIHAGQTIRFIGDPPELGVPILLEFSCAMKEIVRDRNRVTFAFTGTASGHMVVEGEMQSIWAK